MIGINTPDHETQFEQIVSHLRRDNHYVALLQSKDCGNIRNMTKSMIEQFLSETMVNDDQQELMEEVNTSYISFLWSVIDIHAYVYSLCFSLAVVAIVVQDQSRDPNFRHMISRSLKDGISMQVVANNPTWWWCYKTLRHLKHKCYKISFPFAGEWYNDNRCLIYILTCISEYRRRLPIVFIMGIATSSEILHQSLTKASISLLRVEKFWLEQSEVWLNRVLETVRMSLLQVYFHMKVLIRICTRCSLKDWIR